MILTKALNWSQRSVILGHMGSNPIRLEKGTAHARASFLLSASVDYFFLLSASVDYLQVSNAKAGASAGRTIVNRIREKKYPHIPEFMGITSCDRDIA